MRIPQVVMLVVGRRRNHGDGGRAVGVGVRKLRRRLRGRKLLQCLS
jgi:hypothetical protein